MRYVWYINPLPLPSSSWNAKVCSFSKTESREESLCLPYVQVHRGKKKIVENRDYSYTSFDNQSMGFNPIQFAKKRGLCTLDDLQLNQKNLPIKFSNVHKPFDCVPIE